MLRIAAPQAPAPGRAPQGGTDTPHLIERGGLLAALDRAAARKVTVISAPAGSGKSSLLSAWAERTSRRPVFVPVGRDQEDAQQFWLGVLGAICRLSGAEPPATTPEFNGRATVDRVSAALAAAGDAVTLVIDDLHELNSPEALGQLTRLLTHLPPNAHVVLATRRDLRLGLHRLRLAGELSEIRAADLRFTEPEARELLDAAEIALSEASIALLHERTEGWAAGLRLAVLSLAGHPDPERFVAKFSGSNRTVAEYLIAEMLDRQSEDVQSMLLRTSLLDQVNGELADLLSGGSGSERILLELEDANAFVVSLDSERTWFRYHHLFADLLRLQLRRTWPEEAPTLHRQAATWFLRHGHAVASIRHTQAAGDWSDAAATLGDHAFSMMLDGKAQTIQALLRAFPQGADHPELTLVRAAVDVIQGRLDETAADLAAAEVYARTAPADRLPRLRMTIAALKLSLARRRGQLTGVLEQARVFAAPLNGLSDADVTLDSDLRAAALMNLGIVEAWSLSSADGERHLLEGARIAREIGRPYLEVSCLAQLGFAAKLRSFASARHRSEEAVALAERHGWAAEPMIAPALVTLACALIWTGEFDEGARWLRRAERALQTDAGPGIRVLLHLVGGMLHAGRGHHHKALEEFSRAEQMQSQLGPHALSGLVVGWTLATRARIGMPETALAALAALPDEQAGVGEVRNARAVIELAGGDARAALDSLGAVLARGVPVVGDFTVVEAHLLAALAQQVLGDRRSANYSVELALALAEPDRLVLPFAITGSGKLLDALPHHETAHAALLIDIRGVLDGASPAAQVTPTPQAGELSPNGASPQPDEACRGLLGGGLRSSGETVSRRTGYGPRVGGGWLREPPARPEPVMTLPRSVADVLADHVVFEVECIDRMYCNVYVPQLQHAGGLLGYIQRQLGLPIASTAPLGRITDAFSAAMRRFARDQQVPWVDFVKGQRKDDVMHEHLARFTGTEGVLFIGRAQEKTSLFRTERRRDAQGESYPWIVRATGVVNQFYVYAVDEDFGPFFLKFCSYFPYNAKLCLNGHEWAKRQASKAGIAHTALDNGFATCADPAAVQAICDRLGPEQIDALLRKWLARLPHPFSPADREAGYRYDISIWQAEFSLTQMLDRPISGRVFFEQVIRDNLDAGRPSQVSLIFDRRLRTRGPNPTPGRFRTRVITEGVTPSLHIDYKHTTIKQYHKEGRALRTETTINDTRDFGIGKRLTHLPALREIGLSANRRLLGAQRLSHNPIRAAEAFTAVHDPIITDTGHRIAGLRLGDRRAHALLQALLVFRLLPGGFLNRDLRALLAGLLGRDAITAGQMSYDLRRLRAHGLITRIPCSHRYRLTDTGLHHAMLLGHVHTRLLMPALAHLTDPDPPTPTVLRTAARNYSRALDQLSQEAGLAA